MCICCPSLFFANDALFFEVATEENCRRLMTCITLYCLASGQLVHFGKHSVLCSRNILPDMQHRLADIMQVVLFQNVGNYLSLPIDRDALKSSLYGLLLERMEIRTVRWQSKLQSFASKEVLLKAVAQVLPSYCMSIFKSPKKVCKKVIAIMLQFWWAGGEDSKKVSWCSKGKLTRWKEQGGLGFRDLELFNIAMLTKQGWNLLVRPRSLWAKVLKGHYFPIVRFVKKIVPLLGFMGLKVCV